MQHVAHRASDRIAELTRENERLRTALQESQNVIALLMEDYTGDKLAAIQTQFSTNRRVLEWR